VAEYRKQRAGSFGSIHALLNHMLLADQIWMARFHAEGKTTPALDTVLFEDFRELRSARGEQDCHIEEFFQDAAPEFFDRAFEYTNSRGRLILEPAPVAVSHFFNHQTHHRGQVHVMLSQTGIQAPSLDLHRIIHP
jgi:uncharacterized damage-inducible protein DinB